MPIFALFGAGIISQAGDVMAAVAIPWFVLETTGSAARTGLTGATIALGTGLAGLLGGPVVDRLGFRKTSVLADLTSGITVAFIPLLYLTTGLAFWQLLVLVFLGSVLDAPGRSARTGMVPDLARQAGMPIERANSVSQGIPRLSLLVGPPLAGVLIAVLGATNVLWLNAATFAFSAAMIAAFVPRLARSSEEERATGYVTELREGIGFIRRDLLVFSIVVTIAVTNFLDAPLLAVILSVYADTIYGSAVGLGLMVGSFGGGAVAGTVLYGIFGHRLPRRPTFVLSFVIVGLPFWVLAALPSLPVAVAALIIAGVAAGPLNPLIITLVQERSPEAMLGRVLGVLNAIALAAVPLGMLLAGYLLEGVGIRPTVICIAACYLLVTLGMFLNPALREMDATKPTTGRRRL